MKCCPHFVNRVAAAVFLFACKLETFLGEEIENLCTKCIEPAFGNPSYDMV